MDRSPQLVHWGGLLLLAGLLHLAAPAVKQQLVQERGNLLLQLLHSVLLEDEQLGGKGVPVQQKLLVSCRAAEQKALVKEGEVGCLDEDRVNSSLATGSVGELYPAQLVMLTLQALLCTLNKGECDESRALTEGAWLLILTGKAQRSTKCASCRVWETYGALWGSVCMYVCV